MSNLTYVYDGSFDGLLTCVFEMFARKEEPERVMEVNNFQGDMFQIPVQIDTECQKSERVRKGILKKLGNLAFQKAYTAFLADDADKGTKICRYLAFGFSVGHKLHDNIAHDCVWQIEELYTLVTRERHRILGFLRFSKMENGIFFARINPKNIIIPLIINHFADRLNTMPFVIYDETHKMAGIYDTKDFYIGPAEEPSLSDYALEEDKFQRLWKNFYDTIAIRERENYKVKRNNMPKHYWKNLTEMQTHMVTEHPSVAQNAEMS